MQNPEKKVEKSFGGRGPFLSSTNFVFFLKYLSITIDIYII